MTSALDPRQVAGMLGKPAQLALIGNTPLLPIGGLDGVSEGVRVLGKAEWTNPGGSVKDRAASRMVRAGIESGALGGGRTLIDATSGNTGIAFAWLGAVLGFEVHLAVPANANLERKRLLELLGAHLLFTDPMDGTDGAIREARRIVAEEPERWFYPDQYSNPENWRAHYEGTAAEIWAQTGGAVTHFVAGLGTTGTLVGTSRGLRERNPGVHVTAVMPDSPYLALEGLKHLPSARVPSIYDPAAHDDLIELERDVAIDMVRRQARRGLLLGWSAGAAVAAAERVARTLERGVVVTILCDSAERYLSEPLWDDRRGPAGPPDPRRGR
jgi:cysteine synthase B